MIGPKRSASTSFLRRSWGGNALSEQPETGPLDNPFLFRDMKILT
jgi:hypothetical protein